MTRVSFYLALGVGLLVLAQLPRIRPVLLVNDHIVTLDAESAVADSMVVEGRPYRCGRCRDEYAWNVIAVYPNIGNAGQDNRAGFYRCA
ncbi:MAG: hypothetical protein ACI8UP_000965 [Porticoccaceae bacterium]|jgi:hypothetical protein